MDVAAAIQSLRLPNTNTRCLQLFLEKQDDHNQFVKIRACLVYVLGFNLPASGGLDIYYCRVCMFSPTKRPLLKRKKRKVDVKGIRFLM